MESAIIRSPTEEERRDFVPLADPKRYKKTAEELFNDELVKQAQEAAKKKLPFAEQAARDEFKDYYADITKKHLRAYHYIKVEEIKPIKMDWPKFSDLKNFDILDEGERLDEHLSRVNPGLQVMVKWVQYKFKGYDNLYQVNEDGPSAIARAKKKAKE
jgi:hypothetical protein